jgi:hypothetical protein
MSADPPFRMSAGADAMWRRVYATASSMWVGNLDDYYDVDAKLTANAAVVGWWSSRRGVWSRRIHHPFGAMPAPGPMFELGEFFGIDTVNARGEIETHSMTPGAGEKRPQLFWSSDLQACFVFPFMPQNSCTLPAPAREARLVKMWNAGRPARCASPATYPSASLGRPTPGISISYRSDKFSHGKKMDYIHHFEGDVMVYVSGETVPRAIMVRGGRLHVASHGIAG